MSKTRLSIVLSAIFIFATIMGTGPGLHLVNPLPGEKPATILGMPILFAWAVFWFFTQAIVVLTAYCKLWKDQEEDVE